MSAASAWKDPLALVPHVVERLNRRAYLLITNDNGAVAALQHGRFLKEETLGAGCL